MIRTATPDDLPALRHLFDSSNDAPYALATVAEEKCFGAGVAGPPVTRLVEEDGRLLGAAVVCGKWLRILVVAREARRRGIATRLLGDESLRGITVVAAEPGNYFTPGIDEADHGTTAFLRRHGFAGTRETNNLECALEPPVPLAGALDRSLPRRPHPGEAERVLSFIEREFGPIWRFESSRAFATAEATMVITEAAGGEVTGFAAWEANNRGLGSFGPTGVIKALRGRGLGGLLLHSALGELSRLGYERAVIPWTDALAFYRKVCGAEPVHRFITLER